MGSMRAGSTEQGGNRSSTRPLKCATGEHQFRQDAPACAKSL